MANQNMTWDSFGGAKAIDMDTPTDVHPREIPYGYRPKSPAAIHNLSTAAVPLMPCQLLVEASPWSWHPENMN